MSFAYNAALALGSSQTGLTLNAALMAYDGTIHATIRDVGTGFVEVGAGNYSWYYASAPAGYRGVVVYYTGTLGAATDFSGVTVKATTSLAPERGEYLDAPVSGVPAALLASTVDGETLDRLLTALTAVLLGVASPSGNTVVFKKRDGTTTAVTITYGTNEGERTGSVMA